ncbi:hypothetical protein DU002_11165 [Corallincola holothuriorum]|uniref:Tetratricopeptide repeat protein n=1 Tax=Corallincola holothuriorum TaxID=2282215 RepID=A0A368NIK5_9GAMM|nr:VpsP family polysaccharide biosynthesis protein [Corallincola holothuriorum]RCU49474.1 hypothetical protein DU002_11165 [Corallincola holothuriorum]
MQLFRKAVYWTEQYFCAIPNIRKRLVCFLSVVVIFTLSWFAIVHGIANLSGVYAERKLHKWALQNSITIAELPRVEQSIARAIRLQPDNAHYYILQAKLMEWKAFYELDHADSHLKNAISSLQTSLTFRPNWPNTWLDLAFLEHKLSRYDDRFQQAVNRAESLGAYKQDVTLELIRLGFETWEHRSAFMKEKLIAALKRGLTAESTAWKVLALATAHRKVRVVCLVNRSLKGDSALPLSVNECR